MIAKDKEARTARDKFEQAGDDAERQMAFYLRRAFADAPDIFVFNDLRIERNGEFAQIDHLVLHRYGFVIIESKSVVGKLVVNKQGEFTRIFDRYPRGIQSPIQQARLQADLLRALLNDHKETLRRKVFFGVKQATFAEERFQIIVAVSDSGTIKREGCDPPALLKADSVAGRVRDIVATHKEAGSVGGIFRSITSGNLEEVERMEQHTIPALADGELKVIVQFLLSRHTPLSRIDERKQREPVMPPPIQKKTKPDAIANATVVAKKSNGCRHCQSRELKIVYGQYGYYFKCSACDKNTPINFACSNCGAKAKVSKSGHEFTMNCGACNSSTLFHTNPVS